MYTYTHIHIYTWTHIHRYTCSNRHTRRVHICAFLAAFLADFWCRFWRIFGGLCRRKHGPLLGAENTDRFGVPKRGPSFRAVVRTELHPRSTECFRPALYVCMPWRPTCGAWRTPRGPTRCAFRHPKSVRCSAPKIGPYFGPEIRSAFRNRKSVRFSTKNIGPQLRSTRHTLASRLSGVLCVARNSPTPGLSHPL